MYEVYRHRSVSDFENYGYLLMADLYEVESFDPETDAENKIEDNYVVVIPHTYLHNPTAWDTTNYEYFATLPGVIPVRRHATGTFLAVTGKAFRDADNESLRDDMYRAFLDGVADSDSLQDAVETLMLRDYRQWARDDLFNNIDVLSALRYFEDAPNVEYQLNEDKTGVVFTNSAEIKDFIRNHI